MRALAAALALAAIPLFIYRTEVTRLLGFADVFDPDRIAYSFQHMEEILDSRTVERGNDVLEFTRGSYSLPESFRYRDPAPRSSCSLSPCPRGYPGRMEEADISTLEKADISIWVLHAYDR